MGRADAAICRRRSRGADARALRGRGRRSGPRRAGGRCWRATLLTRQARSRRADRAREILPRSPDYDGSRRTPTRKSAGLTIVVGDRACRPSTARARSCPSSRHAAPSTAAARCATTPAPATRQRRRRSIRAARFGPRYVIEQIVVRGNRKTKTDRSSSRELRPRLGPATCLDASDPRVEAARYRLLSLRLLPGRAPVGDARQQARRRGPGRRGRGARHDRHQRALPGDQRGHAVLGRRRRLRDQLPRPRHQPGRRLRRLDASRMVPDAHAGLGAARCTRRCRRSAARRRRACRSPGSTTTAASSTGSSGADTDADPGRLRRHPRPARRRRAGRRQAAAGRNLRLFADLREEAVDGQLPATRDQHAARRAWSRRSTS